jgi:hypothetical protein
MHQTPDIAVTYQRVCAVCCLCDERRVFTRRIEAELWRFTHEVEHSRHLVTVFAVGLDGLPILLDEDICDRRLDDEELRLE